MQRKVYSCLPSYLADIQSNLADIFRVADQAAESIEDSTAYNNKNHPFHAAAVQTYNSLVSIIITMEEYGAERKE